MKKQTMKYDLVNRLKDNGYVLFLLSLLVIVAAVQFGSVAPKFLLALFFKYILFVFTLMFMPFITGAAGFSRSIKKAWLAALILPLLLAVIYQVMYHENILRLWYKGEFDRKYMSGLLQAGMIVPGISFLIGLVFRIFRYD